MRRGGERERERERDTALSLFRKKEKKNKNKPIVYILFSNKNLGECCCGFVLFFDHSQAGHIAMAIAGTRADPLHRPG